jgi:hypothetical protein
VSGARRRDCRSSQQKKAVEVVLCGRREVCAASEDATAEVAEGGTNKPHEASLCRVSAIVKLMNVFAERAFRSCYEQTGVLNAS